MKPVKPVDSRAAVLDLLGGAAAAVDRLRASVDRGDCCGARAELLGAQAGLRRAARALDQLSASADVRTGAKRPACPPDREECSYSVSGALCSIPAALVLPARGGVSGIERVPALYCLVEIDRLRTSHDPERGFAPTPGYPAKAQERDYQIPAERAKVEAIARDYDPALVFSPAPGAMDGTPVVTEGGIVLGGNGRTMATRLVYLGQGGIDPGAVRAYLLEHAQEFGIDPAAVDQFARPMIVRTIRTTGEERALAEWSRRLNAASLSQELDSTRLAVSRARFLDPTLLRHLDEIGEGETLAAYLSSGRSREFVRALQRQIIDSRAAPRYVGGGGLLTEAGRDLVAELLVALLIPDADLIVAWGKGPVGSFARAAPSLAQAIEWKGFDLRAPLELAIRARVTMRAQDIDKPAELLRQGEMFSRSPLLEDRRALVLLYVLSALEGQPAKLSRWARRYIELARPAAAGQSSLFAGEEMDPIAALRRSAEEAGVRLPP